MRIFICLVFLIIFTKLFSIAANGLKLSKLNAISMAYYYLLFYEGIGACLIFCGFRKHYILQKVTNEAVFDQGFWWIVYAFIMMPLIIILMNRVFRKRREEFIHADVQDIVYDIDKYYTIIFFLTALSLLAAIYTFYQIGYISFFRMLFSNSGFDFATSRVANGRGFAGNLYIRNIFFLELSPILSFASYIFYKSSRADKWKKLVIINFILTILAKTYDFSKAPLIVFFLIIFIIDGFFEEDNSKAIKRVVIATVIVVALVFLSYILVANYSGGKWISLTNGPVSRILITQLSGFYMHLDVFPGRHAFLHGASFSGWLGRLFGQSDWGTRSARIIMQVVNPRGVAAGTAGVANTIYLGEAYANWGIGGLIFAPIYVGFLFGLLQNYIETRRKSPIRLLYYVVLMNFFNNTLEGGFIDFMSTGLLFEFFFVFFIDVVGNGFKIIISKY